MEPTYSKMPPPPSSLLSPLSSLFSSGQSQTLWAGLSDRVATSVLRTSNGPHTSHQFVSCKNPVDESRIHVRASMCVDIQTFRHSDIQTFRHSHESELMYACTKLPTLSPHLHFQWRQWDEVGCVLTRTHPHLVHVQFAFQHPCQRGAARGTRVAALAVFLQAAVAVLEMHFEGRRGRCFFGRFVGFAGNV